MTVSQFRATAPTDLFEILNADGEKLADEDIIGTGCVYNLNVYDQYFRTKSLFVKYDLSGDGLVTTEDARLALRISVGLEEATDEQGYAAGTRNKDKITTSVVRSILRYTVGLE